MNKEQHLEYLRRLLRHETLYNIILPKYQEKHRYYHAENHIHDMLSNLDKLGLKEYDKAILSIVIAYHDIEYDPTRNDNEERSAEIFNKHSGYLDSSYIYQYCGTNKDEIKRITNLILSTNLFGNISKEVKEDPLFNSLRYLDTKSLIECDYNKIIAGNRLIEKEYQFCDWEKFKQGRLNFIKNLREVKGFGYNPACDFMESELESRVPSIGIYAGSFDPFHIGHLSILRQAEKLFDKIIILVACNPEKESSVNSLDARFNRTKSLLKFHQVEMLKPNQLLTDYVQKLPYPTKLIRGLRTDTDFKKEEVQLRVMQDLYPDVNVVFLMCEKNKEHISSSMIRMLEKLNARHEYTLTTEKIYSLRSLL